jgi:hypothetical protein
MLFRILQRDSTPEDLLVELEIQFGLHFHKCLKAPT